jgi:LysM repeat protein
MPQHVLFRMPKNHLRRGAVVLTGAAGLSLGVLAAPASAAPAHDWSGVAECESGGNWQINTGNGYYGGLQFSSATWLGHGGGAHAPRADLAAPAQQIDIAERVLATQGVGAWPTCGRHLRDGTTGVPDATTPTAPSPAAAPAAPEPSPGGTYTVRSGDTLAKIARDQGVEGGWQALWARNQNQVPDPHSIRAGQQLTV